jgi:uncharacterized protein (DUF2141 family)
LVDFRSKIGSYAELLQQFQKEDFSMKRSIFSAILISGAALLMTSCGVDQPSHSTAFAPAVTINVKVEGLKKGDVGQICLALFNNEKGFPNGTESIILSKCLPAKGLEKTGFSLEAIPYSADGYALSLFHDQNSNGKLDTKKIIGIEVPAEGFGMSNNPPLRMSAPKWDDCRFEVIDGKKDLNIKFKYL